MPKALPVPDHSTAEPPDCLDTAAAERTVSEARSRLLRLLPGYVLDVTYEPFAPDSILLVVLVDAVKWRTAKRDKTEKVDHVVAKVSALFPGTVRRLVRPAPAART